MIIRKGARMLDFGKNLKKYRKEYKISQAELAGAIGIKQGTIANYENGNRTPTLEMLLKIASYLNISTDNLLKISNEKYIDHSNIDFREINEQILDDLMTKQEYKVFREIEKVYNNYKDIVLILDRVITPIMHKVGFMWEAGKLSVADEHCAAETMFRMVNWLSVRTLDNSFKRKKAVCMTVASEMHTLGIRMISVVLEQDGYQSLYIGNNLPSKELIDILIDEKPELFLLSVTIGQHIDSATNLIKLIKSVPDLKNLTIIIGGQGVPGDLQFEPSEDIVIIKNIESLRQWLSEKDINET